MFANAKSHSLGILGYQFTLLQASNSLLQFLQSHATHTKKILQHSIILLLLLHNEWILGIGIEIKRSFLKRIHILCGKDDAHALVSTHSYQVLQRLVLETKHIVSLIDDGEMA